MLRTLEYYEHIKKIAKNYILLKICKRGHLFAALKGQSSIFPEVYPLWPDMYGRQRFKTPCLLTFDNIFKLFDFMGGFRYTERRNCERWIASTREASTSSRKDVEKLPNFYVEKTSKNYEFSGTSLDIISWCWYNLYSDQKKMFLKMSPDRNFGLRFFEFQASRSKSQDDRGRMCFELWRTMYLMWFSVCYIYIVVVVVVVVVIGVNPVFLKIPLTYLCPLLTTLQGLMLGIKSVKTILWPMLLLFLSTLCLPCRISMVTNHILHSYIH